MTTWLRGARCTDPEAMPEMEARPPAKNRHGGAPRGERPASWDAPRLTPRGSVASRKRDNKTSAPVGAPPAPLFGLLGGWTRSQGPKPGATTRRGNEENSLFDIVNTATANGSSAGSECCASELLVLRRPYHSSPAAAADARAIRRPMTCRQIGECRKRPIDVLIPLQWIRRANTKVDLRSRLDFGQIGQYEPTVRTPSAAP